MAIAVLCGMLNSGCFVITSNHVSKPIAPAQTVEFCHDQDVADRWRWYVRKFQTPDLNLEVGVRNSTERLQVGFLFWVLPIPATRDWNNPTFIVNADFRPIGKQILIDPWNIQYIPSNGIPIAPAKVSRLENSRLQPISPGTISVSAPESFTIEFDAPCNPDSHFKLAIGGLAESGDSNQVTTISYKRAKLVRAGFQLPY